MPGNIHVVLGSQWGDEGKGKIVDLLSGRYKYIARCQGGSNAGHTLVVEGKTYKLHLVPSGILNQDAKCIIGNGVVVHIPSLLKEIEELDPDRTLKIKERLFISDRCHIVFDFHQIIDGLRESELGSKSLGTTKKGIGPCYSSKMSRGGLRMCDLRDPERFEEKLRQGVQNKQKRYGVFDYDVDKEIETYKKYGKLLEGMIVDSVDMIHTALDTDDVLVEGANAAMLDVDFGTYPYVTSSNASVGGVCTGLGVPPQKVSSVIGVVKAYTTRVGLGPFPTEELGEIGEKLQNIGREYGVTTGRKRRCGWFDAVVVKYTSRINGITAINLTKVDILTGFEEIKLCVKYDLDGKTLTSIPACLKDYAMAKPVYETLPGWTEDITKCKTLEELPANCRAYIKRIEETVGCPVKFIGTGPGREQMIEID